MIRTLNLGKVSLLLFLIFLCQPNSWAQSESSLDAQAAKPLKFIKKQIASESFESVGVFDVNNDQIPDLVSGSYWYEGPDYWNRHFIGPANRVGEYWDDFSNIPLDVDGDGYLDFVTGGWFGKALYWWENPGTNDEWKQHKIGDVGNIETTQAWDVDGDGILEIIPNTPNDSLVIFKLITDSNGKGTGEFQRIPLMGHHGHGLGFGDINNDGRGDFITVNGWLEAPANPFKDSWKMHPEFELGTRSVPMIAADVNDDGLMDFIAGQGHSYGLDWYEQQKAANSNQTNWVQHNIDPYNSQYHAMLWEDLDNDGTPELITGKRYRAHNGNDPGSADPVGIYYFKWNEESFVKQIISFGEYGVGKGTGLTFCMADLNQSGYKDIVVAGKDGLYIFYNQGNK